jgi:amidase
MVRLMATVLCALAVAAATPALASATPRGLERASIAQLQAKMASGRLTSEALTRFYLRRIARLDRKGPALHAVIAVNPDAVAEARALDAERRLKGPRGPLHGVPILIKDNIETADTLPTTAGSLAMTGNFAGRDAAIVARLRAAGAVILGKTNLSEWANFRSTASVSGWSAVGGLVKNPYALDHSACGSSAGSAAAVAAGFAAAAVGTETDGSIVCPSSMNGVVGLKPTLGRLPTTGIVPIAHSQDAPGPITRTVADAAVMLAIMQGGPAPDGGAAADLHGRRFGVLRFAPGRRPETEPIYEAALARLRAAGAILVEVRLPDSGPVSLAEQLVLPYEFKADLNAYLAAAPAGVKTRSLPDMIAFNAATPAETPLFGQEIFIGAQATTGLQAPAYLKALADSKRLAGPEGIDKLLTDNHLDALVAPTAGPTWKVGRDKYPGSFSTFPAVAGYPHLTLPMGQAGGRPVGLSFIGTAGSDEALLGFGAAFERTGRGFVAPTFPETVGDGVAGGPGR